jgi:hypothetical protein
MNNEPVAWAMFKGNTFMDAIHPDEHTRFEGGYTIPLYTHPAKTLTDEEIEEVWIQALKDEPKVNAGKFPSLANQPFVFFARAILRKAQEK